MYVRMWDGIVRFIVARAKLYGKVVLGKEPGPLDKIFSIARVTVQGFNSVYVALLVGNCKTGLIDLN